MLEYNFNETFNTYLILGSDFTLISKRCSIDPYLEKITAKLIKNYQPENDLSSIVLMRK